MTEQNPNDIPMHFSQGPSLPKQTPAPYSEPPLLPVQPDRPHSANEPSIFAMKRAMSSSDYTLLAVAQAMDTNHDHRINKSELLGYVRDHTDEMGISAQTNSAISVAVIQKDVAGFADALKSAAAKAQLAEVKRFDFSHMDVPTIQDVQAAVSKTPSNDKGRGGR